MEIPALGALIEEMAVEVYRILGAGHSERVYHNAMEVMLRNAHLCYETERIVPIHFKNHVIGTMRADLIVEKRIIVELKSIKTLTNGSKRQLDNYLLQTGYTNGILINFPNPDGGPEIDVYTSYS